MAHPDDPELACGGTIATWARRDRVTHIIVSCGEKGTWEKNASPLRIADAREREAQRAARTLGSKKVVFLRHPDGAVAGSKTLALELAALIRHLAPHTIVTHDPWRRQFHPDHRATGFAVIEAIMIARDWHFYPVLREIGLKAHRATELLLTPTDEPTFVSDVTGTFNKKLAAIRCHKSQLRQLPGWEKRITAFAASVGKPAGFTYGEGFYRMRI